MNEPLCCEGSCTFAKFFFAKIPATETVIKLCLPCATWTKKDFFLFGEFHLKYPKQEEPQSLSGIFQSKMANVNKPLVL